MNPSKSVRAIVAATAALALAHGALAADAAADVSTDPAFMTIAGLDAQVFDAFNHCDAPGQLDRHAAFFAPDIEFYHDQGGVTWTRDAMIANTARNVCGHFRREMVPDTMRVYSIKDFGAIEEGVHRFCQFTDNRCEGMADFVIVWRRDPDRWRITRVLSYGHRAAP